jgi:hypothetical protein
MGLGYGAGDSPLWLLLAVHDGCWRDGCGRVAQLRRWCGDRMQTKSQSGRVSEVIVVRGGWEEILVKKSALPHCDAIFHRLCDWLSEC